VLTSNGSAWASAAQDGWILTSWAALTRTGATTFTTTTNVSGVIQKGDKLKFTDTTTKYLNVVSAVWGGATTVVTTIANDDYALVGNPSAMSYSKVENPQGWPGWFNYSPTITFTAGTAPINPTSTYQKFGIHGRMCTVNIYNFGYTAGATVTAAPSISLPVAPIEYSSAGGQIGAGNVPNLSVASITTVGRVFCTSVSASALQFFASYWF
jgi:hypothetical protein